MNHVCNVIWGLAMITTTSALAAPPDELAQRRARIAEAMGSGSMLVLYSPGPQRRAGDTDHPFRQEDNLYYLTGIDRPATTLVMIPGEEGFDELLLAPEPDPLNEVWNGKMPTFEELATISGIDRIESSAGVDSLLAAALGGAYWGDSEVYRYYRRPSMPAFSNAVREGRAVVWLLLGDRTAGLGGGSEERLATMLRERYPEVRIRDLTPIVEAMREIKSPGEVELLQRAIDITGEAQRAAMHRAMTAGHEYQVEATIEFTFRDLGACCAGFPSIVAGGSNATILHYSSNQEPLPEAGLMLLDIGAEVGHYTADITRTFPLSGRFSDEQREIYEIVLAAWRAGLELMRPGGSLLEVHQHAADVIGEGLLALGLIATNTPEQVKLYFLHGVGHPLGLWTHDVFDRTRSFEPGMVATIEPGIYVRAGDVRASDLYRQLSDSERATVDSALERYDGIGVRIEDDILITADAPQVLSAGIPLTVEEIEAHLASAPRD